MAHAFAGGGAKSPRVICLAMVLFLPPAASADTITLLPNRDTSLFQDMPMNSDGAGPVLFVGDDARRSSPRRGLMGFDIAGNLPAGSIITGVQLSLFMEQKAMSEQRARPIELHRLLADWGEGTRGQGSSGRGSGEGFRTLPDGTAATWSHRFYNTVAWTTAGGDFAPTASGSTMVGIARGAYLWDSTPNMVSDVQGWLDDPASNFGWLLLGNESTAGTARFFDSREATNSALRPALQITFSGSAVPEPSALVLLGLGTAGSIGYVMGRRKRSA